MLPANGHAFFWRATGFLGILAWAAAFVDALGALQIAALLHRTTTLASRYRPAPVLPLPLVPPFGPGEVKCGMFSGRGC